MVWVGERNDPCVWEPDMCFLASHYFKQFQVRSSWSLNSLSRWMFGETVTHETFKKASPESRSWSSPFLRELKLAV